VIYADPNNAHASEVQPSLKAVSAEVAASIESVPTPNFGMLKFRSP
jgi:hypothetical protein